MPYFPIGTYIHFESMDGCSGAGKIVYTPDMNPEGAYYLVNLHPDSDFGWYGYNNYPELISKLFWNVRPECIKESIKTKLGNTLN